MNNHFEQEVRYHLLQILSREPALSQRDMAKRVGVSLGKVNYCISELAKKGLIKIVRFKSAKDKIPYTYILTPHGVQEKAKLTLRFLKRKLAEYEEIKRQIEELTRELDPENGGHIAESEWLEIMAIPDTEHETRNTKHEKRNTKH